MPLVPTVTMLLISLYFLALGTQLARNGFGRSQQPTTGAQWYGLVLLFLSENEHHCLDTETWPFLRHLVLWLLGESLVLG